MSLKKSKEKLGKGAKAPDFELKGVDGNSHGLEDFKDHRYLLLVFTCNHCPYAQSKMDVLNELAKEEDLCLVGINPNSPSRDEDSYENMKNWVEEGRIDYDYYLEDESQEVAESYGAVCTPDPYLFKKKGEDFFLVYHGRIDDAMNPEDIPTENYIRKALKALREGEEPGLEFMPSQGCSIKWV